MTPDSSDPGGWWLIAALAVAALATAVVSTVLDGPIKWVGVGIVILVWVTVLTVVWW